MLSVANASERFGAEQPESDLAEVLGAARPPPATVDLAPLARPIEDWLRA